MREKLQDWWRWYGSIVYMFLFIFVILVAVIFVAIQLSEMECNAKTADIGFDHRWSALGGCQIEVSENQWIPLESYYFKQE